MNGVLGPWRERKLERKDGVYCEGIHVLSKETALYPGGDGDLLKDFMRCEMRLDFRKVICVCAHAHTHTHTHTLARSLTHKLTSAS